ncbi:hypothetical protein A9Q99_17655 [Gammaproteobacteria bacterium 45_16_T64]|nr:hypothetical protein A9Q99_17655 [Gammaproteobacteria bacterium 45_16_T64]
MVKPSPPSQAPTDNIQQELLRLLARQGWMGPIPTFLLFSVVASFAASYVPTAQWLGWIVGVGSFLILRSAILIKLPSLTQFSDASRVRVAVCLSAVNGGIHALSLFFFPYFDDYQRTIHTMIIMGIGSISIMTTAGYLPISLAYMIPTIIPTSIMWVVMTVNGNGEWIGYIVAIMLCASASIMLLMSKESFALIRGFFEIRDEQRELNRKLQQALQEAENASRAKTRFLASASHDLRQPIHALSLFSGALAKKTLDSESREIAEHMDLALQSLVSHLDSLLDISKLDAGIVNVNNTLFDIRLMGERLQGEFIPTATAKGLKVWFDCIDDALVESDEFLLDRIIRNLLSNAIKYTNKGSVELSIETDADVHRIIISDTGQGIPQAEQDRIFEEFYQIDNPERDNAKGLGLGLSIVKRLVDLLDIDIHMSSTEGEGTCFTLTLPRSYQQPTEFLAVQKPSLSWQDLKTLVIDDVEAVGIGMKILLEGLGCQVLLADSTESALQVTEHSRPDIILADFRLRGKDNGILSIRAIRAIYPDLPAILISGDTAPERLLEAKNAGIQMLHKPVLVEDLEQAIATSFIQHKIAHTYIEDTCLEP